MIWGGGGQRIHVEFFFSRQQAVELFFFRVVEWSFLFSAQVAVEFFFPLNIKRYLSVAPYPFSGKSLMVLP